MEQPKAVKKKHPRINMAFYDDNLDYVREAAYQSRMSITEYMNHLIREDRKHNPIDVKASK